MLIYLNGAMVPKEEAKGSRARVASHVPAPERRAYAEMP
jgi:hypothetical protein